MMAKKKTPKHPTDREKVHAAMSFLVGQCDDGQIKLLLKMTLRDWVNWIESKRGAAVRRTQRSEVKR